MQHQWLLTIRKGDSWLVCAGIAAAVQIALLAFSAPNTWMELNNWVLLCAAIYHDFIVSLQKLSLLICILLLRLDCMVGHLRETQCPADSMLCLQYLHCQKESTVWTQGACQPMCNILCNCTFALQACWVACHTQRYGQTALLLDEFNTGENLLWCQSYQQVSTACHAAIVML